MKRHSECNCKNNEYADFYNDDILNFFNPEPHLKDIEPTIRNKLIDSWIELKGFKFVIMLIVGFKK